AKLLCTIGDLCASRHTRLDRLELANIAIEYYHQAISVAPHGTLDVASVQSDPANPNRPSSEIQSRYSQGVHAGFLKNMVELPSGPTS
ncbi:hypothetical protein FRC06_005633, partial [Ceratobasidium sp. 370]